MHVILNVESLMVPSGGIGRYTRNLLKGLHQRGLVDQNSCFANSKWVDGIKLLVDNSSDPSNNLPSNSHRKLTQLAQKIPLAREAHSIYKDIFFQISNRKFHDSIYHEPNYILKPFSGTSITTVHDLSFIKFAQHHPSERVKYLANNFEKSMNRAAHIITDSEYIRRELIEECGLEPTRVSAIHLGVDQNFKPRREDEVRATLSQYKLRFGRFLLSVATLEPRKNVSVVLDSYLRLEKSIRREYPLILVGGDGWNNASLMNRIVDLEKKGEVSYLGFVPEKDLKQIISGAHGFVFLPLYEGFGLPPLEAIASGIPTLLADVASLPEVIGGCALYANPIDIDNITLQMERLVSDNVWRQNAIQNGINRAKRFTWSGFVDKTVDLYDTLD